MNIKKITAASALTGALLMGSFAIGYAMAGNSNDEANEKKVTELQNKNKEIQAQLDETNSTLVSETYQITAITQEGIHGEIANGFGYETIYYTHEELEKFGIHFKLGDYVVITWSFESRESRDVNEIEHMYMLVPMSIVVD